MTKVALYIGVMGSQPNGQVLLHNGRALDGIGNWQNDAQLQETTVGQLVAQEFLDEVTRAGLPDSHKAWLFDNTQATGEGLTMVLVEVAL